ncbi:MAG: DNA-binding protein HRm [Syntrophorhabdaceae bacterium PtaU1.Bin034]|jgi:DNA-binding protein HU-beta|nr:MAG: DNA-binding protein HRm [Syntrophorhabdaceae bacterium PtaU1.Bin034]
MTKTEFVGKLAETGKITKKQAETVFSAFVETITAPLKGGDPVHLPGLGTFSSVKREARKGRNPRTGQEIKIPARTAVKFSTSNSLNKQLNEPKKAPAKAAVKPAKKKK